MSRYPRDIIDKMWRDVVMDEICSNTDDYEKRINNLIQIERWGYDPRDSYCISDRFLGTKIKQTISMDLENKISNYLAQIFLILASKIQPMTL